ncbi:hypothetical protein [Natrinema salinisoli]|uniref:hypothetical protein n=1 Tax=Natrinema salinisoli TaxID=2878535 RepID=UPI001CEFF4DA|nr:hypothetical protein [Natrinema salinisoli]
MVEHTEGGPVDDRDGDSEKTMLGTILSTIQLLLIAMAVFGIAAYGMLYSFPLQPMLAMVVTGAIGAILIEIIR